jgi:hypothetical protein
LTESGNPTPISFASNSFASQDMLTDPYSASGNPYSASGNRYAQWETPSVILPIKKYQEMIERL